MTSSNANRQDSNGTGESRGSHGFDRSDRLDAVFGALSNERRRAVVAFLRDHETDTVGVERLTEAVATRETGDSSAELLGLSLRHTHLPKLSEAGVVAYAPERSLVRYEREPLAERLLDQT